MADLSIVTAGIRSIDDCPALRRIKAFLVDQGVQATLEHVFRDRTGNPVDLSGYLVDASESSASSESATVPPDGSLVLRVKEALASGLNSVCNPLWEIVGNSPEPSAGLVHARLPASLVEHAGLYVLNWAIKDVNGDVVFVNDGLLSVERSQFAMEEMTRAKDLGPPTINEIRMELMDTSSADNALLDDIEFSDDQLLNAIAKPIELWNETPPPIGVMTTRDFPYRGAWRRGIIAQLLLTAAHNYRRNMLQVQAGGVTVADKNKEREYLAAGRDLWQEYTAWLLNKKVEINARAVAGSFGSTYGRYSPW